jgi:hypothetical protein
MAAVILYPKGPWGHSAWERPVCLRMKKIPRYDLGQLGPWKNIVVLGPKTKGKEKIKPVFSKRKKKQEAADATCTIW